MSDFGSGGGGEQSVLRCIHGRGSQLDFRFRVEGALEQAIEAEVVGRERSHGRPAFAANSRCGHRNVVDESSHSTGCYNKKGEKGQRKVADLAVRAADKALKA